MYVKVQRRTKNVDFVNSIYLRVQKVISCWIKYYSKGIRLHTNDILTYTRICRLDRFLIVPVESSLNGTTYGSWTKNLVTVSYPGYQDKVKGCHEPVLYFYLNSYLGETGYRVSRNGDGHKRQNRNSRSSCLSINRIE